VIDGKALGICFMNHPASYRFPTDWHVRNYGLFAANAFMLQKTRSSLISPSRSNIVSTFTA